MWIWRKMLKLAAHIKFKISKYWTQSRKKEPCSTKYIKKAQVVRSHTSTQYWKAKLKEREEEFARGKVIDNIMGRRITSS